MRQNGTYKRAYICGERLCIQELKSSTSLIVWYPLGPKLCVWAGRIPKLFCKLRILGITHDVISVLPSPLASMAWADADFASCCSLCFIFLLKETNNYTQKKYFPRKAVHMTGQINLWANAGEKNYKEGRLLPNRPASWQQTPQEEKYLIMRNVLAPVLSCSCKMSTAILRTSPLCLYTKHSRDHLPHHSLPLLYW